MMSGRATASMEGTVALIGAAVTLLLRNGQTTERTVAAATHLGGALGYSATLHPGWSTSPLLVESLAPVVEPPRQAILAAEPIGVDMNKVARTMDVVDGVREGRLDLAAADAELAEIARLPPVSLPRFAIMAGLGAAALGVIFGATHPLSLLLIGLVAACGAMLRRRLAGTVRNIFVQPLAAALLAGLVGAAAVRLGVPSPLHLVAVCPCMVLVPGPHLLNGILDLARTRVSLGIARIAYASLIILMICVGLIAGLMLGGAALPPSGTSTSIALGFDIVAAGIAVAAYGSFFSMPWRTLTAPVAIGMLAHGCRWVALAAGANIETGALIACLVVGTLVTPLANRRHWPFAAVAFASVVSLIPGVFLFRMASGLVELMSLRHPTSSDLLVTIFADGTTAALILLAMAFGLVVPKMAIERLFPVANRVGLG